MRIILTLLILIGSLTSRLATGAAPFDNLSLQGFLKTSAGVPVDGTFNARVTLLNNGASCWNTGVALIPIVITEGAFAKTLSGGVSSGACSGTLSSDHFLVTGPFTWKLDFDMDSDGTPETSFNNIPISAVPLAMAAERLNGSVSGSNVSGGTFGAVDGSALTNLNASNLSSGAVATGLLGSGTANATTYLRGDATWAALPALGESNTASNVGAGSAVFKQKTGVDLEFRSLVAGSTRLSFTQNANDITVDINEGNLSLPNFGGTLSGSQISGGTFGAVNGSNLTSLPAANLTGTIAAISGANLTSLNGSNIASGTVAAARLPLAGAAADGIVTFGSQTLGGDKTFSGAVTLASSLTNNGTIAWTKTDVATVATITCLSSSTPVVRLTGTTVTALQGITPGVDGQLIVVYTDGNIGTGLTIAHNNAGACANGRIFTNTNANVVSTTATSTAAFVFMYNLASLRWHLITSLQ